MFCCDIAVAVHKHIWKMSDVRSQTSAGFTLVSVSSSSNGRYISHKATGLCVSLERLSSQTDED